MGTEPRTDPETRRALHDDLFRLSDGMAGRDIKDRCFAAVPALLADADALAGALADVERQRAIIRQARRHVEAILKQADAALAEMRRHLSVPFGGWPGEGPLRGVRGNLLALYDDLARAALAPDGGTVETMGEGEWGGDSRACWANLCTTWR